MLSQVKFSLIFADISHYLARVRVSGWTFHPFRGRPSVAWATPTSLRSHVSLGVTLRQRHALAPTGNQWAPLEGPSFSAPPFSERIRGRDGGGNAPAFPGLAGGRLSEARRLCVPSRRLRTHFVPAAAGSSPKQQCPHRPGLPGGCAAMVRVAGLRWS